MSAFSDTMTFSAPARWSARLLKAGIATVAALLVACGGGSGNMGGSNNGVSGTTCSGSCASTLITMQDAAGDFGKPGTYVATLTSSGPVGRAPGDADAVRLMTAIRQNDRTGIDALLRGQARVARICQPMLQQLQRRRRAVARVRRCAHSVRTVSSSV